jgi:hypothetical protein
MKGNVLITGEKNPYRPNCDNSYPAGNVCPRSADEVGFVNAAAGNYRLAPNSPFKRKASDGTDPGANLDVLEAALERR